MNVEPLDHEEIDRRDLVSLYLREQLSDVDLYRFEAHLVDCQECLDALEETEALGSALRAAVAEEVVRLGWMARAASWSRARIGWASLALLAVASLGSGWWLRQQASSPPTTPPSESPSFPSPVAGFPTIVLNASFRSADSTEPILLEKDHEWFELVIELDRSGDVVSPAQRYAAELRAQDLLEPLEAVGLGEDSRPETTGRLVKRWPELQTTPYQTLEFLFPVSKMPAGDYVLRVWPARAEDKVALASSYPLRITPKGNS